MEASDYDQLKTSGLPDDISEHAALGLLAGFVDDAGDKQDEQALKKAVEELNYFLGKNISDGAKAHAYYFLGNAWAHLKEFAVRADNNSLSWEDEPLGQEILSLRRAIAVGPTPSLPIPTCQILTNLGNALSHIGRPAEAIEYYNKALENDPTFAMATGSKGHALSFYADALYDRDQASLIHKLAYPLLNEAARTDVHETAKTGFSKLAARIEGTLGRDFLERAENLDSFPLGSTEKEKNYRSWCLKERLFLNPLNDATDCSIAAHDPLTCPSIITALDEGPYYHAFYNQIKQEFVSARYLFYRGMTADTAHFSDRGVLLYNTLDYPAYGVGVEQMRLAFRAAYSLVDKIAYFLNAYLTLGVPGTAVTFKSIWYEPGRSTLRSEIKARPNWPLRGLFWLSKDLVEPKKKENDREKKKAEWQDAVDPDAQKLNSIRNHLEHKYLKLHQDMWAGAEETESWCVDTLAHSLSLEDFTKKTVRILKMVRAALIYLALALHIEERRKTDERDPAEKHGYMPLDVWDDDWKT
jgi:tetratricopeptide (TPR) repeat protein